MGVARDDEFDPRLVQRARRGDIAACTVLVRELQDVWYRYCRSMLHDGEVARDAAQETGLRFLAALPRFKGESRLRTWSLGIALNVCREARRAHRTPCPLMLAEREPTPPDQLVARTESIERLEAAIAALPERQREAVVLYYLRELTLKETASAMGCTTGTVKATVSHALRRLREAPPVIPA